MHRWWREKKNENISERYIHLEDDASKRVEEPTSYTR